MAEKDNHDFRGFHANLAGTIALNPNHPHSL
jgi:hypothetical protein